MNIRDWLDLSDELEAEFARKQVKNKIQHKEKTHNKKEWKGIKKNLEKKNVKKKWDKKRTKTKNVKKTS